MQNTTLIQKVLITLLGFGFFGLCILFGYSFIIVANEPVETATPQINFSLPTLLNTPTLFSPTETLLSPTLESPATIEQIPTPIPSFNDTPPPSGKIAFACYVNQIDQICLINSDGSGRKQLTNLKATAFYPSVSPDGQTIYFSSRDTGNYEIYSINVNGNNLQKLTNNIGALYAPELSPNGEWIIFTKNGDGLWIMKPDGSNAH